MIFFNQSKQDDARQQLINRLCEHFQLEQETVAPWVTTAGKRLTVTLPFAARSQFEAQAKDIDNVDISIEISAKNTKLPRLSRVKNIIAVASGKGGVGKSATSVNLAFALKQEGASVGILDADIYGPSIPIMLGNPEAHPSSEDQRHMQPLEVSGVVANSIGYLVPPEKAAIWRGPMVSRALQQLVNETLWPELDYLIVDMPPGTGDIQLTLAQQVPVTAAVVVTTPQDLALADAKKGIAMFEKVEVPVLGLLENMSYYQCPHCGHTDHVFASGGGDRLAAEHQVALLGQLPLDIAIRQHADGGTPLLYALPDSPLSEAYRYAARQISQSLALSDAFSDDQRIQVTEKD